MKKNVDIVIVGGGIIGLATAYYLCGTTKIAVVEKEYLGSGSTGRCIGGIRQQFSTPQSIALMKENLSIFSQMKDEMGVDVEFHQGGYLLLAHSQEMVDVFKGNIETQKKEGVNVSLLTPKEAKSIVPDLDTDGLLAAAFCPDDGQAFPFSVMKGYKKKLDQCGCEFFMHNPVVKLEKKGNFTLTLKDGTVLEAEKVLLSAGGWTKDLGAQLGLKFPLFPERHEAMITERIPRFFEPMIVDYRPDGCYFQQLVTGQIIGCYTPDPNVPGVMKNTSIDFLPQVAKRMTRLLPVLKKAAILRHWSGSYTMTKDGNPIVDKTDVENLYVASGMSGHGFMFGPAIGKHLAHFITEDEWDTDFSEFALNRVFKSKEKLK
ncbi:MAG: FAD-binding oxidoreductase [bacterium]|nr:FAD-binding oxidoreductase [bacterium]